MQYLCVAFCEEGKRDALPPAERDALERTWRCYDEALRRSGHLIAGGALLPARAAVRLQPRAGTIALGTGPFAGTRAEPAAFFVIEARDLNEAIRVAARHPAAQRGEALGAGIEVRPIEGFAPPQERVREP
jgi:hypothetical protein